MTTQPGAAGAAPNSRLIPGAAIPPPSPAPANEVAAESAGAGLTWYQAASVIYRAAGPNHWTGTLGALAALLLRGDRIDRPLAVVIGKHRLSLYDVRADGAPGNCILRLEITR